MSSQVTRVLIADDHEIVLTALRALLENVDHFELVGEASNGAQAVALCAQHVPDVVLMDLVMPIMDGVAATREIRAQFPQVKVIVLTAFRDEGKVHEALEAGAVGYVGKDCSATALANTIKQAHLGRPAVEGSHEEDGCGSLTT